MFTQKCKIDQYNRKISTGLEELGYVKCDNFPRHFGKYHCIIIDSGVIYPESRYLGNKEELIDCTMYDDRFLALAAIQDNTDKNQWFIYDDTGYVDNSDTSDRFWYMCREDKIEDTELCYDLLYTFTTKATPIDIIREFTVIREMYIAPCFIKSTETDIYCKLGDLGFKDNNPKVSCDAIPEYICTRDGSWFWTAFPPRLDEGFIDCGENKELFITLSLLKNTPETKGVWYCNEPTEEINICCQEEFGENKEYLFKYLSEISGLSEDTVWKRLKPEYIKLLFECREL